MANILISGANEGIGWYITERLLEKGHSVTVLDVKIDHLNPLQEKYQGRLFPIVCDMRDTASVTEGAASAVKQFGTIDIAIHNACRCTFSPLEETSEETFHEVFDVNYFGALRLAKAVLPYMREQGYGKVMFTSSGVGVMGFFNISPYASSKGAIESLAKCLSIEYQKLGISFHIIHPPITRTKSSDPFPLPNEFKADPKVVGYGIAEHIGTKSFLICHSVPQKLQVRLCYLLSLKMGRFMSGKMTTQFLPEKQSTALPQ